MEKIVSLKTETWKRDSHGLFDYESKDTLIDRLEAGETSLVLRMNDMIIIGKETQGPAGLARISFEGQSVIVKSLIEPLWKVIRYIKGPVHSKGHILKQGEIIKFGRVKYAVKEICVANADENRVDNVVEVDECGSCCKICLSETVEDGNPLIAPCRCAGTMKFIHVECLKMCARSQMTVKTSTACVAYSWKSINCTLCAQPFPGSVKANGRSYEILLVEKPEIPYLIIESLTQHDNKRGMHTVSMKNSDTVVLGRGHDSDIRISDISVSRVHAKIKFSQGNFNLEDYNSKFGTLIQVDAAEVSQNQTLSLQSGRTLLKFKLKPK